MGSIVFTCPTTGHRVQEWLPDDESKADVDTYCMMGCRACGAVHLVSPVTKSVFAPGSARGGFFDRQGRLTPPVGRGLASQPPSVRTTILQYVAEKTPVLYGDSERRLRKFTTQLSVSVLDHAGHFGIAAKSDRQHGTGACDASPALRERSRASHK